MSEHSAENDRTWRDYCKHNGPCQIVGSDRCSVPDDPAYVAAMETRYPRPIPPAAWDDPDPDDPPATEDDDPMWGRPIPPGKDD